MNSWRKLVLDVIEGRVPESGDSVSEAIERCRCEPPATESGSFSEAVDRMAKETKKIKEKVKEKQIEISRLYYWINSSTRSWEYPPDNMDNAVRRAQDILDEIVFNQKYTDKMLERLQNALDKADALISPVQKAEEEKKKKYDKTPCGKIFQELIFGWKKGAGHYKEYEDNTEPENDIQDKVTEYIAGNETYSSIVKAMKQLKACVKEYPEQLRPTVTHAWRGVNMESVKNVAEFLPLSSLLKSNDRLQIGKRIYVGAKGTYKPKREIESWAAEPSVADRFAVTGSFWSISNPQPALARVVKDAKKFMAGKPTSVWVGSKDSEKQIKAYQYQDIIEEFSQAREELMTASIAVIYYMKVDKDFIFAEWFSDYLSVSQDLGKESEVTHIVDERTVKSATVYIEAGWIDAVKHYNEKVGELRVIMGTKMPKKIKEIESE